METQDLSLINQYRKDNYELDRLMKDHDLWDQQISQLEKTKGLSDDDTLKLHELKKKKLDGRDQIETILADLRS